jgi:hypothetical protein
MEFESVAVVMHGSSLWMLDKEEGLSGDLTGCSSGRRSDGCSGAARSGGGGDLSSGEREFLRKRNPKKGEKWIAL